MIINITKHLSKNNQIAISSMLFTVILFSILPIAMNFGEAKKTPFLFNTIINLSSIFFCSIFLTYYFPKTLFNKNTWKFIYKNPFSKDILLASFGAFGYGFFALSLRYIDISVATILFETWPIFIILLTSWLFKNHDRYQPLTTNTIFLILLSFFGFAFVMLSQSSSVNVLHIFTLKEGTLTKALLGAAIVIAGALIGSLAPAYSLKWGNKQTQKYKHISPTYYQKELFFIITGTIFARIINSVVSFLLSYINDEIPKINIENIFVAFLIGIFISGIGGTALRYSNMKTSNLAINALLYTTPIFSLLWLSFFSLINVPHPKLLILGTIVIIITNIVLNSKINIK